uniref:Uncharacterized protein n=1 Tax=Angiostrongylus cantonensis TaxID=6313 RepID=A0A0K0DCU2_ANGCA
MPGIEVEKVKAVTVANVSLIEMVAVVDALVTEAIMVMVSTMTAAHETTVVVFVLVMMVEVELVVQVVAHVVVVVVVLVLVMMAEVVAAVAAILMVVIIVEWWPWLSGGGSRFDISGAGRMAVVVFEGANDARGDSSGGDFDGDRRKDGRNVGDIRCLMMVEVVVAVMVGGWSACRCSGKQVVDKK